MATPGPALQVEIVTKDIGGDPRIFVDQPHIHIGSGSKQASSVKWTNGTGAKAWFWFPNGDEVFSPWDGAKDFKFTDPILIPPEGLTLNVRLAKDHRAHYHYHVYCEAAKDCAQGNSEPGLHVP